MINLFIIIIYYYYYYYYYYHYYYSMKITIMIFQFEIINKIIINRTFGVIGAGSK